MPKEKKESKVTASFRINPEIMQLLREKKFPLSEVVQTSLIHFLRMPDADKFIFLKTYDIQAIDVPSFISDYSGRNWDEYVDEITYDVSLRKLLTLIWQSEDAIADTIKELFLTNCDDLIEKDFNGEVAKEIFYRIINNFNKIYVDCPLEIKNALVKYLLMYALNHFHKNDSSDFLQVLLNDSLFKHGLETGLLMEEKSDIDIKK